MQLPSVIALRQYVKPSEFPAFTRFNVFLRDRFSCQYCGSPNNLTFDHVNPRRLGGRTSWENIVAACSPCNLRKGGRTPSRPICRCWCPHPSHKLAIAGARSRLPAQLSA
jgi:5-methylcytosine-specific restriction endonuclease McrA